METEEMTVIPEVIPGQETTVVEKTADERIAEADERARVAEESERNKEGLLTQAEQRRSAAERALSAAQVKREEETVTGNLGELLTTDPEKAAKLVQSELEKVRREAQRANITNMAMAAERRFDDLYPDLKSPMDKKIAAQFFMETDPNLSVDERVKAAGDQVRQYVNAKKSENLKAKEDKNKELHKAQVVTGGGDKLIVKVEKEETTADYLNARQSRLDRQRGLI